AAKQIKSELCARACKLWEAKPEQVEFSNGAVRPLGALAEKVKPMTIADFAKVAGKTGGPIGGVGRINAQGAGPSFGTHLVDLEVDPETGRATILRYTVAQDAGRALHPAYVEGQYQGGAVQGIGWALKEEYINGEDGKLQTAGFLDYRMPVASAVPMIDAILVEVANPKHPYGVRGVGRRPSFRRSAPSPMPWRTPRASASPSCPCRRPRCSRRSRRRASARPRSRAYGASGAGGQSRAAHGGRRRVSALGDVREAAFRTAHRAGSCPRPSSRRGYRGGHRRPDLPGHAPRADPTRQRGLSPPTDRGRYLRVLAPNTQEHPERETAGSCRRGAECAHAASPARLIRR